MPGIFHQLVSEFPLHTYPPITPPSTKITSPTIWIHSPLNTHEHLLSTDVECLKWQAYLALRGLKNIAVRWDISPEGAIDARLPNLHVPLSDSKTGQGKLLPPHLIPGWVDAHLQEQEQSFEGYRDQTSCDESRAWVALLEGHVHAALVLVSSLALGKYLLMCYSDSLPTTAIVPRIPSFQQAHSPTHPSNPNTSSTTALRTELRLPSVWRAHPH